MRRTALPPLVALICAAALSAGPAARADADARARIGGTHCGESERVAYSCSFGRKVISVCVGTAGLAYRYGPLGKPELSIVSDGHDGKAHWGSVTGGGGGSQEHIRFTSGAFHYIVFSSVQGSLHAHPGRRWSGYAVYQGPTGLAEVASKDCARNGELQRLPSELGEGRIDAEESGGPFDAWY